MADQRKKLQFIPGMAIMMKDAEGNTLLKGGGLKLDDQVGYIFGEKGLLAGGPVWQFTTKNLKCRSLMTRFIKSKNGNTEKELCLFHYQILLLILFYCNITARISLTILEADI